MTNSSCARLPLALTVSLLLFAAFLSAAKAANWYVDAAATGSKDGKSWTSAWTSFAGIAQSSLAGGDVIFVKGGVYDERFTVSQGGTDASKRITYKGVGAPVIRGIDGKAISFIAIIGFEFTQPTTTYTYSAITMAGAKGWLIQDNYFHDTSKGGIEMSGNYNQSDNVIRHNRFSNIGGTSGGAGQGGTVIQIRGDRNLCEYNQIDTSLDRVTLVGTANVIRNNYYSGTDTVLYPNSSVYPFHTDGLQPYSGTNQILYERNWDADNRDSVGGATNTPNGHGSILQISTGTGDWAILRYNVMVREAESAYLFKAFNSCWLYNSTYIAIGINKSSIYNSAAAWESICDRYDFRNNTWCYMPQMCASTGIISTNNNPTNYTHGTQHSYNVGTQGVLAAGASPANLPQVAPQFVDGLGLQGHDDYRLQYGSPLRGAGSAFTKAVGSGSTSSTLTVTAAKGLFDGWGIADPDWIKIGSGSYVQIKSIDYATNIVTLSSPRNWNAGDPVIVKGMEDVGAMPYAYASVFTIKNTTPTLIGGSNTLSATIDNPDAVRKVEFLVDGLPVGTVYSAPYSLSFNSDGAAHTVTARAYAAWASTSLVADAVGSGNVASAGSPASGLAAPNITVSAQP